MSEPQAGSLPRFGPSWPYTQLTHTPPRDGRMNQKRAFKTDYKPEFLHHVIVRRGNRDMLLSKGTLLSVRRKPGLIAGKYAFLYAEHSKDGTLLLTVEGPDSRVVADRRRKIIRESDIKVVHVSTRPGNDSSLDAVAG
ncbi:hypothetical protein PLEIONE_238 [Mycobacterium phage Pleione]|nr:gp224 [Mycobacterium phage Rizal]YP_008061692.1 hypothetical protein M182_gp118 [Mycobacterium phage Astraea]YP_009017976.1 hypothetical protein PLEIONE_238 [Mycobacterium phage Pleione]YP_010057153.1 hypothetical protein KHO58_gp121 [Mycobacterium phage Bigswole]AER25565.1 hypothetical protein WALLY_232 [Mycobacterium phage Wally]AER49718.1 hypothetical protein PIO_240 [Mycobacterium phage Pio]AGV99923.1 hypothetical protein PBI_SHRIMP_236 [Mycobacterium phage Shrimp]ALF51064.1 hypotheti